MTVARASTLLFPCTSSLLSWLMAWFLFSACSLLWLALVGPVLSTPAAAAGPVLDGFCRRDPALGLDRKPVLVLAPVHEPTPVAGLVGSMDGAGGTEVSDALAGVSGIWWGDVNHKFTLYAASNALEFTLHLVRQINCKYFGCCCYFFLFALLMLLYLCKYTQSGLRKKTFLKHHN